MIKLFDVAWSNFLIYNYLSSISKNMKKLLVLITLIICFLHTSAQDSNVLISLAAPVFGIKVKANFPGSTGNWARGYYFVNENNTENFFGFGAYGSTTMVLLLLIMAG
jgi:hypothetical protein